MGRRRRPRCADRRPRALLLIASLLGVAGCSYDVTLGSRPPEPPPDLPLDTPIEPGDTGPVDLLLSIRTDGPRAPISRLIYGMRSQTDFDVHRQSLYSAASLRWTAYDWENNASNAGQDYQFQNDGQLSDSDLPGEAVAAHLSDVMPYGAASIFAIPIGDWVSADKSPPGDVRNSGADYLTTRFRHNHARKNAALSLSPDTHDDSVYQDEFVSWVHTKFPGAEVLFTLDEMPELWTVNHAEVRAANDSVTYAELVQRNTDYAEAVKAAWPEAAVIGLATYGWQGLVTLQNAPDSGANGDWLTYYLSHMAAAEVNHGHRLIDYIDVHWDSEARGENTRVADVEDATARDARLQAPRSLWDPAYVEDSWITQTMMLDPIRLIPRLQAKIDADYPGTKICIGAWSFGGGNDISGAIAAADTLGIFGKFGVGAAALHRTGQPFTFTGFHVFTNFDGAGAHFGDTTIAATTTDAATSSVYASLDRADQGRVVIVAINKADEAVNAGITVAHPLQFSSADVYVVGPDAPTIVRAASIHPVATNAFTYSMPAYSISVLLPQR